MHGVISPRNKTPRKKLATELHGITRNKTPRKKLATELHGSGTELFLAFFRCNSEAKSYFSSSAPGFTSPCVGSSSTWRDLHEAWAAIPAHRFSPGRAGSFSWSLL